MKRPLLRALAGAAAVTMMTAVVASAASRREDTDFASIAIAGRLHFEVYLPDGYDGGHARYPVLYLLHGLPSGNLAYRSLGFAERALDALRARAILVVPQGARDGEPDPEYVDRGTGDRWETAIAQELPHVVDSRFRTIRSRAGRALIGISAGGYGAMHLALGHLGEFSVVESWSGYFHPTDPTGTRPLLLGGDTDLHEQLGSLRARLGRLPTTIAFYVGRSDSRFYAENQQLNHELTGAGIPHVFRAYAGGHDQTLWQRYAAPWLALALRHLAAAH